MIKKIPHSFPTITKKDISAVTSILSSGRLAQGSAVELFEKKMAERFCQKGAAAASSGTTALHLLFLALDIKENDEIIMPSYGCVALLNATAYCGAKPVLVDVCESDFSINPEEVKKKLSRKTKAILVPHLFGACARVEEMRSFGVCVVEDIAQSAGAAFSGKPAGSFGDFAICSFYATKMLTTGEGGMILGKNKKILESIRDLRDYDQKKKHKIRYNYKMTDFQAALGLSQLAQLESFIQKRKKLAALYTKIFTSIHGVKIQEIRYGTKPVFYRFVLRVQRALNRFDSTARRHNIECKKPVYSPLHPYVKQKNKFPVSDKLYREARSIPIYPALGEKTALHVARTLSGVFAP